MEFLLNRFRNLTVLLVVILAQLVLLAYQVKSGEDVRLIRRCSTHPGLFTLRLFVPEGLLKLPCANGVADRRPCRRTSACSIVAPLLVLLGVETDTALRWHRSCPVAAMNYTDPQPHDSSKSTSPQRLSINGTVVNAPPGWKRNASAEWDRTEVELK